MLLAILLALGLSPSQTTVAALPSLSNTTSDAPNVSPASLLLTTRQGCVCSTRWEDGGVAYRGSCKASSIVEGVWNDEKSWCKVDGGGACGFTSDRQSGGYQWDWCPSTPPVYEYERFDALFSEKNTSNNNHFGSRFWGLLEEFGGSQCQDEGKDRSSNVIARHAVSDVSWMLRLHGLLAASPNCFQKMRAAPGDGGLRVSRRGGDPLDGNFYRMTCPDDGYSLGTVSIWTHRSPNCSDTPSHEKAFISDLTCYRKTGKLTWYV